MPTEAKLKRKVEFELGVCAISGCNKKTQRGFMGQHRGKQTLIPICDKHVDEAHALGLSIGSMDVVETSGEVVSTTETAPALAEVKDAREALVAQETTEAREALAVCNDVVVLSAQDELDVSEMLAEIKGKAKRLETMKQEALRPLRSAIETVTGWFREPLAAYGTMETVLKQRIVDYRRRLESERAAALEKMTPEAKPEEIRTAIASLNSAQAPTTPGVSVRKVWTFEIVDVDAVPREFCSPDNGKIRAAVASGNREIDGVRIFENEVVASRSA